MTKETQVIITNTAFDGMLSAQMLKDEAVSNREKNIADMLYNLFWAIYQIILSDRKGKKDERN